MQVSKRTKFRVQAGFFLLGTLNNFAYVVVGSAAQVCVGLLVGSTVLPTFTVVTTPLFSEPCRQPAFQCFLFVRTDCVCQYCWWIRRSGSALMYYVFLEVLPTFFLSGANTWFLGNVAYGVRVLVSQLCSLIGLVGIALSPGSVGCPCAPRRSGLSRSNHVFTGQTALPSASPPSSWSARRAPLESRASLFFSFAARSRRFAAAAR